MKEEGRLSKWNDDRGFGFITPASGQSDIFVHISAFPKGGYRPKIGERLIYATEEGKDGKKRAIDIDCPERPKKSAAPKHTPRNIEYKPRFRKRRGFSLIWTLLVLIGVGGYAYFQSGRSLPFEVPLLDQQPQQAANSNFRCDGRIHCSQMRSCDEAKFFLKYCPGVKMDGNHDGVPCEEQWCY